MAITAQQVKELRELTDCGIMDCKKALTECDGDIEAAKAWLREKGMAKAEKKSSRIAAEGVVNAVISDDAKLGALVEINVETDFAAQTDKFKNFVNAACAHIIEKKPASVEDLMAQSLNTDASKTVEVFTKEAIADISENINIRRFAIYEVAGNGSVETYIHAGGKVGVLIELVTGDDSVITKPEYKAMAKDIGMQIAAANPSWVTTEEVPQSEIDKEVQIITNKALEEGKPEKIIADRIVPGQIKNFYSLNCLYNQEFVKDDSMTVQQYVEKTAKELGTEISVVRFTRFGLGEGIEKKVDDFAEEVRKQAGL